MTVAHQNIDTLDEAILSADLEVTKDVNFKHVCQAIDLIATTRARANHCVYLAKSIARLTTIEQKNPGQRAVYLEELREQLAGFERAFSLLNGRDGKEELKPEVCRWVAKMAAREGILIVRLPIVVRVTAELCEAADAYIAGDCTDVKAFDRVIYDNLVQMTGYFEIVTEFINSCWSDFVNLRNVQIDHALQASRLIDQTLVRLEKIGKHVRLVSLNASVEASRVGDAGRGLGIIATEFKSLAEEIQQLSAHARENIDDLTK
ncbi:MAG: methyl-accepting chemotaxis protein [Pseudomonadota bacterium]